MACVYTFTNGGSVVSLEGIPALKAYLATGDNLARLLPKLADQVPGLRRTPVQSAVDLAFNNDRVEAVRAMSEEITAGWKNAPKVKIFNDMNDAIVPEEVRAYERMQKEGGATGTPKAFIHKGEIYLNANEIESEQDAAESIFHEALGHYGLRGLYGAGLGDVLDQIIALRRPDVLKKVKEYGLDASIPRHLQIAAEEVLATMAQAKPELGFVRRAIAAIRAFFRKYVPGFAKMNLTDRDIVQNFILPARAFVQYGGTGFDDGKAAFIRSKSAMDAMAANFKQQTGDDIATAGLKIAGVELRNARKANEGKVLEASPYTAEQVEMFNTWDAMRNPSSKYLFHTTPASNLDSIKKSGLVVGSKARFEGVSSAKKISLSANEAAANYYASSDDVMLRVSKKYEFDDLETDLLSGEGTYTTGKNIPADALEIKQGRKWVKLSDYHADQAGIRFRRSEPKEQPEGLTPPEQGLLRRVQANMQDNMNRVRQIQDRIAQITGKAVPSFQDYYGAETRRPGRIAARLEDARKDLVQPIVEGLAKAGHTVEQLGELLHAMHAPERNERVAKINPEMDSGSGMTNAEAAAVMAKYKDATKLKQLAAQAQKMARATLELKREYGLIDKETFDFLFDTYEHYVPLKGDGEYGPRIKRAMGHDEREEFILENISRDYEQAVVVGEKNVARQSLLAMALQNPDPELWTVGVPPKGRYVAGKVYEVRKVGSKEAEATFISEAQVNAFLEGKGSKASQYEVIDSGGERVQAFVRPLQDNEVMVYVEGRPVRIQIVGDEQLARQLRPLDQGQMNVILEGMRSLNRYLSRIYTGYNPAFILRNAVRDALTGTVNILGNEGATTAAKAWARYPTAVKAMGQWAATGKAPNDEVGKLLTEYRNQGGKTGASYMSDLEEQGKTIARMYEDAYGAGGYLTDGKYGKAAKVAGRKIVGGMAHVVEVANQATENGLRFALYMAMRDQGIAPGEAAKAAKSVTVDFDRKGAMTGALGAIYLFFNPAVQGTANAIKTLVKGEKREQAWMALGALAALGLYAATSGMDDDKDRWLGTSWDTRSRNLILKISDKTRLNIPMSYEFAPFYAFGVAMGEALRGESKLATAGRVMSSFFDAYFPLQGAYIDDSDNHGLDAVGAAMPTVIKPAFQAAVNRNTFGSQIAPDNQFVKDQPDNLKMFRNTKNTAYDAAAQKLAAAGEALGAGRYENDVTKVSPETLKHFWRTYTGGLGAFVADSAGLARMTAEDAKQVEIPDIPFVKDFVKQDDVKAIRGRFYDVIGEAKKASNEFKQAKKAGDDAALSDLMDRPEKAELLGYDRMIRSTQKAVAELRDAAVDINADPKLSPSDKRAKLKELEAQEEDLYRSVIGAFK